MLQLTFDILLFAYKEEKEARMSHQTISIQEAKGQHFTLEYGQDGCWYVGLLVGVPGVMSQGPTLKELKENIVDAYRLMRRVRASRLT